MKATGPGRIIARALADYTDTDTTKVGKIVAFVGPGWYDPNVFITSSGDVQIAKDGMQRYVLTKDAEELETRTGIYEDAIIANMTGGKIKTEELEVSESILVKGKSLDEIVRGIVEEVLSTMNLSQSTSQEETPVASSSATVAGMSDEEKQAYAMEIGELIARVEDLEKFTSNIASDTAFLKTLAQGSVLGVGSASATLDAGTEAYDFTVNEDLMVLGRATVSDLGVTGVMTAGLLQINGIEGEINTIATPLKLQSLAMGDVEVMGGKVRIDTKGNITTEGKITASEVEAKKVTTEKIQLAEPEEDPASDTLTASAGTVVLKAGDKELVVKTSALTDKSLIFTTPDEPVAIGSKKRSETEFAITVDKPPSKDININWWIVN
jgi:hypothetical protein